jgi:hypothetical protein
MLDVTNKRKKILEIKRISCLEVTVSLLVCFSERNWKKIRRKSMKVTGFEG